MKSIGNFTSIESTNEGFKKLKLLTEERNGWNDPTQVYTDAFYRNWLLLRMEDWSKLDFERNIIIGTPAMTFAVAKARVLTVIKSIQDKIYMTNTRHLKEPTITSQDSQPSINMDSASLNFQGLAVQQPKGTARIVRCYNCGTFGHMLYQCTEPWCSGCQQTWRNTTDTRYHNMSKCPSRPTDTRLQSAPVNVPKPSSAPLPAMQNNKRLHSEISQEAAHPKLQPIPHRIAKAPFPPRGTATRPMRINTATTSQVNEEVDYNNINSLRAYVARAQQYEESTTEQYEENLQDADWNPDLDS